MRVFFLLVVLIHGLIHLSGFVKAFSIKEMKELTLSVSKPAGIFWLITAAVIIIYGILFQINSRYAWLIGFIAVIFSQILIFFFWKDAKFGTILNLIILFAVFVSFGSHILHNEFSRNVNSDLKNNNSFSTDILTESGIAHLPLQVQKYLYLTKSVGKPKIKNFRAEFTGGMRSKPGDDFMKLHSVQYNFYDNPSRYFYMTASKMGLPATGLHIYQNENASFQVKLLNWLTVINARGDKMNQAETVTLLNDMCFIAPATLVDNRIKWESIDNKTVKAIFTNGNISVSAKLFFNENNELVNFISYDRYDTDGKKYDNYPWSTPVEEYREINGYLLPGSAKLIYHRPDGDFTYGELVYKSVRYNLATFED